VSPFIGRLDDVSTDGLALIEEIRDIYDNYGSETQILAASVDTACVSAKIELMYDRSSIAIMVY
jgi:transaldolase